MKKVLSIVLVFSFLISCNNEADSEAPLKDSALEKVDSTAEARIDSIKQAKDSLESMIESSFEKTDSANKALADSVRRN
jgi:PBP1b-binding outer membrane lipoprotein LpoB